MKDWAIVSLQNFFYSSSGMLEINYFKLRYNDTNESIDNFIGNKEIWNRLGTVFKSKLLNAPYFIKEEKFKNLDDFKAKSHENVQAISLFITYLWFVKDNSCNISEVRHDWPNERASGMNTSHEIYTTSKGNFRDESFSGPDINYAMSIMRKYNSIRDSLGKEANKNKNSQSSPNVLPYNSLNRIERAMVFLFHARTSAQLEPKIAFYVLVLECLFSAEDSGEISHKISERVALYIGESYNEKMSLFKSMKLFYGVRSKYIHGQLLDRKLFKSNEDLQKVSLDLDNLVRKVMTKAILVDSSKFTSDDTQLSFWFNELIFNQDPTSPIEQGSTTTAS